MTEPADRTLFDRVRNTLLRWGERRSVTFLRESATGMVDLRRTFAELDRRAREIAGGLAGRVSPGSRVLLLYPQGLEFLEAFLGCLYAGVISVPAPMPRHRSSTDRIHRIRADADIRLVLTNTGSVEELTGQLGSAVTFLATDADFGDASRWRPPTPDPHDKVYLQYTSGSTSDPKGVVVTQDNLLHNGDVMRDRFLMSEDSVLVGWIPHFHDMGLIGLLLQPMQVGCDCAFTAPLSFVKRPMLWLDMITRFRATNIIAPDFAYDLCTTRITDAQLSNVDLSTVRIAVTGSEPVRASTLEAFIERFAPAGFRPEAVVPSYGLAEATLLVSAGPADAPPMVVEVERDLLEQNKVRLAEPGTGLLVVGHGSATGHEVRVVDRDSHATLPEGEVGELWIGGRSLAAGYWNQPEVSAATFQATTAEGDGPFLRTGDLGFWWRGELFITGRVKDVIIVQGRNIYPQDLEFSVRDVHPALRTKTGAAFAVDAGREHVVLVQEVRKSLLRDITPAELAARMRQVVVAAFDVPYPSIVLVDQAVPRTTSGKVQRRETRKRFLAGELTPIHEDLAPALRAGCLAGTRS
jgi:acyl-CoA synthetase (AMP-forming)/AMP-acid ligase II